MIRGVLKVKKLHPDALIPRYQTDGAACFDLNALMHNPLCGKTVSPGMSKAFDTGLSFEVPAGYVMLIFSRSGHGFNCGIRLSNATGVIDSDYRGEVKVKLHNDSSVDFHVSHGDRIAQAMIIECGQWDLIEADELSATGRGDGGFGSTGVRYET